MLCFTVRKTKQPSVTVFAGDLESVTHSLASRRVDTVSGSGLSHTWATVWACVISPVQTVQDNNAAIRVS